MEITLSELLKGKPTVIKGKEFLATKDYVQTFIDEMSVFTKKFIVNVQEPPQIILTNAERETTYNRVWIQAIMPESYNIENLNEIYHFIYGLDTRIPVYKIFRSYGSCVFDAECLTINKIEGETAPVYSIKPIMECTNNILPIIQQMKHSFLETEEKHKTLGELIEKAMLYEYNNIGGKTKLSPNMVIKAYECVYMDSFSKYYVGKTEQSSVWNYFSAFTDLIDDKKDLINFFEKNHLVYLLFNELINAKKGN